MTHQPFDEEITTTDEFETALDELFTAAIGNDIDPRGSWVYRDSDDADPDWEVVISELETHEPAER